MNNLFTTNWKNGSVNDRVLEHCKANNIEFRHNHYFQSEILINNKWIVIDYKYDKANDILTIFEKEVK